MNIHCIQHVPFEGPGSIAPWADSGGHRLAITRLHAGETLPEVEEVDLLVVLGGPMSVNDDARYPWLSEEKRYLNRVLARGISTLGICLGAQLLASVLGARVFANAQREIGWFPVEATPAATTSPLFAAFPPALPVFHWHGETFDLPSGATHLARSAACEHQAFSYGETVLGLQFHLETTPAAVADLISNCRDELQPGPYVQREEELRGSERRFAVLNEHLRPLLSRLIAFSPAGVAGRERPL